MTHDELMKDLLVDEAILDLRQALLNKRKSQHGHIPEIAEQIWMEQHRVEEEKELLRIRRVHLEFAMR